MTRRCLTCISMDVLKALVTGPHILTHLMMDTNTNYAAVAHVAERLADKGLVNIRHQGSHTYCSLTPEGRSLVLEYAKIILRIGEI